MLISALRLTRLAARSAARIAGLAGVAMLAACSTVDDLAPSLSAGPGSAVAVSHPRFSDSDPHKWEGGAPWTYAVHGTDVSKYQRSVDWRQAKASGVSFAFIKATEGGDRIDDYFDEHWRATRAAGIPRAALTSIFLMSACA